MNLEPATVWLIQDEVQLGYMLVMQFLTTQESITLSRWDSLGWDLAFLAIVTLDSVSIMNYGLVKLDLFGMFPDWFFVKWAQVEQFN